MRPASKLFIIKLVHTLIWCFFVSAIGYVLYSGISGEINPCTWIAAGLIIGEGIVLVVCNLYCPLTLMARKYSDSTRANFDIFLPEWLARHNKTIFTAIYLIGLVLVLVRQYYGS